MSSPSYDWNDLKYFLACARAGSLSKAGRILKVDQTTVSRRLTALEIAIGARLFDRTAPRTALTLAGESLLETAQSIEHAALEIGRVASGADERLEGVVRVATSETLSVAFLSRQLASLHRAHPGIELELVTGTASTNLLKREADLALRAGVKPTQQSLVVRKLGRNPFHLYASEAYRSARPRAGRAGLLDGHDVISFCDELSQSPPMKWLDQHKQGAHVVMRTNSILTAAEAALGGWGIVALPAFLGTTRAGLVLIHREPIAYADFWLIVHPDLQHTGRVRAVIEHLTAVMRDAGMSGGRGD
ncbi:MAG: LysR family transcriptional regulator [Polyangiales bacterium]